MKSKKTQTPYSDSTLSSKAISDSMKAIEELGADGLLSNLYHSSLTLSDEEKLKEFGKEKERLRQKSIIDAIDGDSLLKAIKNSETKQEPVSPLLSIVVIFNEENEKRWIAQFVDRLPPLAESDLGLIEIVMCKNVGGKEVAFECDENVATAKGLIFRRCKYTFTNWRFDDARNAAKSIAQGDWILSLDTDEYIDIYQLPKIISEIENAPKSVGGIFCTAISHIRKDEGYGLEAVQRVCRLFRNDPEIFWRSRCHEFVDYSIQAENGYLITESTITIMHDGYESTTTQGVLNKFSRNWKLLREEEADPYNEAIGAHAFRYSLITAAQIRALTGL